MKGGRKGGDPNGTCTHEEGEAVDEEGGEHEARPQVARKVVHAGLPARACVGVTVGVGVGGWVGGWVCVCVGGGGGAWGAWGACEASSRCMGTFVSVGRVGRVGCVWGT
jgi:hypothetical protein